MVKLRATRSFGPYKAGQVYEIDDTCAPAIRALGAEDVEDEKPAVPSESSKTGDSPLAKADEDEDKPTKRTYKRRDMTAESASEAEAE